MNAPALRFLLVTAALGLAAGPAFAAAPIVTGVLKAGAGKPGSGKPGDAKLVDPFDITKTRIDLLLKSRVNPEPLPAVLPNPFTLPNVAAALADDIDSAAPADPAAPVADVPEPGSDTETLVRFAGTLKISGTIQLNGQVNIYINQLLYKEGDIMLMDKRDPKSAIKVVRIAPGLLTLGFNEARHTIRLKN